MSIIDFEARALAKIDLQNEQRKRSGCYPPEDNQREESAYEVRLGGGSIFLMMCMFAVLMSPMFAVILAVIMILIMSPIFAVILAVCCAVILVASRLADV